MVKSVVREHHWSPDIVGELYLDKMDWKGLKFWYNDVMDVNREIKKKTGKT